MLCWPPCGMGRIIDYFSGRHSQSLAAKKLHRGRPAPFPAVGQIRRLKEVAIRLAFNVHSVLITNQKAI